jgi:hypothetical protein
MTHSTSNSAANLSLGSGRNRRREMVGLTAVFLALSSFYIWTASPDRWVFSKGIYNQEYYNLLIDGFRAGKLSLIIDAPDQLRSLKDPYDAVQNAPYRVHDVSYYKGAFYLYYGATPAVTLFWPYRALTGGYLSQAQACVIYSCAGLAIGIWLLAAIRRRFFPESGSWQVIVGSLGIGLCTMVPSFLSRISVYEVPIAAAFAYFMFSATCVFYSLYGKRRLAWLSLASLSYGLAVGARPTFAFGAVLVLIPVVAAWLSRPDKHSILGKAFLKLSAAAVVPIACVVGALMVYNYRRFANPFEFGVNYQLSGNNEHTTTHFSFSFFWYNLRLYFLEPARLSCYFPFVKIINAPRSPAGYLGIEDPFGALPNIPVVLFAVGILWVPKVRRALLPFVWAVLLSFIAVTSTVSLFGGACNRYMVDFLPALVVLSSVGFLTLSATLSGGFRQATNTAWIALLSVSAAFNIFASFSHNDLLRINHPKAYSPLAHMFNWPSKAVATLCKTEYGPVSLTLRLPKDQTGKLQPLVVSGLGFMADYVYLYYSSPNSVAIGFEHTGYGGPVTQPILVDYNLPHVVTLESGLFYPPLEHPYFDRFSHADSVRLKTLLRITVDGVPYTEGSSGVFDPIRFEPMFGYSGPDSPAFRVRFTGQILDRKHADSTQTIFPVEAGPLKVSVKLPPFGGKRNEPLVCTGVNGKGDLLFVTYLDEHHVSLTLDHWAYGGPKSAPVEVAYEYVQNFEISLGSFYPLESRPSGIPAGTWDHLRNHLFVALNGVTVFDASQHFYDSSLAHIKVGVNAIQASTTPPEFTGAIVAQRHSDPLELGLGVRKQ